MRSEKAVELARDLLRELTSVAGWNEAPNSGWNGLVYSLADFIDPEDRYSLSGLIEGRGKYKAALFGFRK